MGANNTQDISARIEAIIRNTLELGDDVKLTPESDLLTEVGIDSLEAFESVATLHELLGVKVPDDLAPKSIGTIKGMTDYIVARYSPEVIQHFLTLDIDARLKAMHSADSMD
jgi:acyl carrier protein